MSFHHNFQQFPFYQTLGTRLKEPLLRFTVSLILICHYTKDEPFHEHIQLHFKTPVEKKKLLTAQQLMYRHRLPQTPETL